MVVVEGDSHRVSDPPTPKNLTTCVCVLDRGAGGGQRMRSRWAHRDAAREERFLSTQSGYSAHMKTGRGNFSSGGPTHLSSSVLRVLKFNADSKE
jgi:hypothetical protein